jgi:hypothetical protein
MSAHIRGAAKAVDRIASAARRLVAFTKVVVIYVVKAEFFHITVDESSR